jgi:hypothetical protein
MKDQPYIYSSLIIIIGLCLFPLNEILCQQHDLRFAYCSDNGNALVLTIPETVPNGVVQQIGLSFGSGGTSGIYESNPDLMIPPDTWYRWMRVEAEGICNMGEPLNFSLNPGTLSAAANGGVGGHLRLYINGWNCTDGYCPLPSDYGVDGCNNIFTECPIHLADILYGNKSEIECKPWIETEIDGEEKCNGEVAIYRMGGVGIGTSNSFSNNSGTATAVKLKVTDGIIADKVKVAFCDDPNITNWCDYVFEEDYRLLPLKEVKRFIAENGHLHNTPSAAAIDPIGGIEIKATTLNQQEKIEEIFLHLISLKKEANQLQKEIELAAVENKFLKKKVKEQKK